MMRKSARWMLAATMWSAVACAQAAGVPLTMRAQATAISHELLLGDVLALDTLPASQAQRLASLRLGPAPMVGQVVEIERGAVQRLVAAAGFGVSLGGPAVVKVRREAQRVEATTLCEAALEAFQLDADDYFSAAGAIRLAG